MVLEFGTLINGLLVQRYETAVKLLILFGLWMMSKYYTECVHPNLKKSKYFFVGTINFTTYFLAKLWWWAFWLVTPVMLHPNVPIDNILIFLSTAYGIIIIVGTAIVLTNAWFILPEFALDISKIDINYVESRWLKKQYTRYINKKMITPRKRR